jgi:hypothetical protein
MAPVYTFASRSTVADQPKADACRRAPSDRAWSCRGALMRRLTTRAQSAGSCPSTSTPERPSLTTVRRPPTRAATTGVPQACASSATSPNDSEWDGVSTIVAARYHWASSACGHGGSKRTLALIPR